MQSSWILLVLFTALVTVNCQINQMPLNVTAKIGGNVTLRCGVDDPDVYTEWYEYITTSTGNVIFSSESGVYDPDKYAINGTFNLVIKNLELMDGGYYGCKVAGERSAVRADVVVIEEPKADSEPLFEGDIAIMMCTTRYQSASHDQIKPSHIPKAEAYIYDDTIITDAETIQSPGYYYETRIRMNYSATVSDNGRDLTCRIYTADPVYEDMTLLPLDVKFPVHNLQFSPRNEFYYVGEYVNCTAEGNPTAEYEWIPEVSGGGAKVYQSTLHITSTMVGENIWTCYARNTAKEPIAINGEISFEVRPDDSGSGEVGPGAPTEAWVVAVAVIVPLAVIAVIVVLIVVFLVKKRKAPASDKPKPVQSNPNFEESSSSTDENYPENYANGKPKPPAMQQAKPQPQPKMTNPGYSMNPAGRVGYLPPNHPHNRSPGYADLGIKHIPAYAQPPSLNSSLDHNIGGGQPNGVNGQNLHINPNPYSRAPIVIARPENPPMASMNQKRLASLSGSMASLGSETGV